MFKLGPATATAFNVGTAQVCRIYAGTEIIYEGCESSSSSSSSSSSGSSNSSSSDSGMSAPQILSVSAAANWGGGSSDLWQSDLYTNATVSVAWDPPLNDGGNEITGYRVTLSGAQGSAVTLGAGARTHTFIEQHWGRTYCSSWVVSVVALSAAGDSPTATATSNPMPDDDAPTLRLASVTPEYGAPGVVFALEWSRLCVGTWSGYNVEFRLLQPAGGEVADNAWNYVAFVNQLNYAVNISNATSGDKYEFRVRAGLLSYDAPAIYSPISNVVGN